MNDLLRVLLISLALLFAGCGEVSEALPEARSLALNGADTEQDSEAPRSVERPQPLEKARRDRLRRELKRVLRNLPAGAFASVAVQDSADDDLLFDHQASRALVPASNTKLFTGAMAIVELGNDFVFKTPFIATKGFADGHVSGDLLIKGMGDPSISGRFVASDASAVMAALASRLFDAGVRSIEGGVVGDGSLFSGPTRGEKWPNDPAWRWWMVEPGALVFNDNHVDIECTVRNGKPAARPIPDVGHVTIDLALAVTPDRKRHSIVFSRADDSNRLRVSGRIWKNSAGYRETANVHDGALYFARALHQALRTAGVEIGAPASRSAAAVSSDRNEPVMNYTSRLLDTLPTMLDISQNLYAEMYHRRLGVEAGFGGTFKGGSRAMRAFLAREGILEDDTVLTDGSGLSKANRVSARQIIRLLAYMARQEKIGVAFRDALPTPGTGTLRKRMKSLAGRVRAKTGTLNRVSALSGYVRLDDGRWLRFSSLFNQCNVGTARRLQDRICKALAGI